MTLMSLTHGFWLLKVVNMTHEAFIFLFIFPLFFYPPSRHRVWQAWACRGAPHQPGLMAKAEYSLSRGFHILLIFQTEVRKKKAKLHKPAKIPNQKNPKPQTKRNRWPRALEMFCPLPCPVCFLFLMSQNQESIKITQTSPWPVTFLVLLLIAAYF